MYGNIGKKIKGLAVVIFILETIAAVLVAIPIIEWNSLGILILILGPAVAWILSWVLYGFGELIDKVSEIARNTQGYRTVPQVQMNMDYEKTAQFDNMYMQGMASEAYYPTQDGNYQ